MTTQVRPQTRRIVFAGALVALALPALSACGSFDYPTDRPNVIANGGYDLSSAVRVNAARIVTDQEGKGVFVATFNLNPKTNPVTTGKPMPTVTGIATASTAKRTVTQGALGNLTLNDAGLLNLADPATGGIAVTGDFKPGDVIPITISFRTEKPVTVQVPVVTKCGPYQDVVASGAGATASAAPKAAQAAKKQARKKGAKAEAAAKAAKQPKAADASATPIAAPASPSASAGPAYTCDFPPAELPGSEG